MLTDPRLYKSIESVIAIREQGNDGMPRMDPMEYAAAAVDEVIKRTVGRV
jgi:hypothetical protein